MVIKNKEMNNVINHRFTNVVNLNEFKLYPSNTLGFKYQQFLKDNNIPPFSYIDHVMKKIKDSSPIIAFCKPEIVFISNQMCQVEIPLIRETKSHIGSMGFGE